MGDEYASEYIIRRKQKHLKFSIKVGCTSAVIFLWDITKGKIKILNYFIEEWHTYTPYDIFWNHSTYPTVCVLLDTWHRTDHCITVCGKWMFGFKFLSVISTHTGFLKLYMSW